jgi:hypothetical protein
LNDNNVNVNENVVQGMDGWMEWQFITAIFFAYEEHSNVWFRFYTTMAKVPSISRWFAGL